MKSYQEEQNIPKARVQDNELGALLVMGNQGVDVEGTPALTELHVLLAVQVLLVAEEDDTTLGDECGELLGLLLGQFGELDAVQLGSDLGSVINALSDAGEEGLLLGVSALTGNASREGVAVSEGGILLGGGEDDIVRGSDGRGHCCESCCSLVVCWEGLGC